MNGKRAHLQKNCVTQKLVHRFKELWTHNCFDRMRLFECALDSFYGTLWIEEWNEKRIKKKRSKQQQQQQQYTQSELTHSALEHVQ